MFHFLDFLCESVFGFAEWIDVDGLLDEDRPRIHFRNHEMNRATGNADAGSQHVAMSVGACEERVNVSQFDSISVRVRKALIHFFHISVWVK